MLFPAADPAPIGLFMFGLASALSAVRFGQPSQGVLEYQRSQDLLEYHEPFRNVRQAHRSSRGPCADYSANLILSSLLSFNHHQSSKRTAALQGYNLRWTPESIDYVICKSLNTFQHATWLRLHVINWMFSVALHSMQLTLVA